MKKIDVKKSINFNRDDILIDILSVKKYLSRKGYFSDDKDFKEYDEGILYGIKIDNKGPWFTYITKSDEIIESLHFIPEVGAVFAEETKEKIFRPYKNIHEFCNETGCEEVGIDLITVRNKNRKQECVLLYTGYSEDAVHLGGYVLTFETLVKHYEFYNCGEGKWLPFGIEE